LHSVIVGCRPDTDYERQAFSFVVVNSWFKNGKKKMSTVLDTVKKAYSTKLVAMKRAHVGLFFKDQAASGNSSLNQLSRLFYAQYYKNVGQIRRNTDKRI
jgi:hypothetical protein